MAKAEASAEELVGMIERGELRLPQSHLLVPVSAGSIQIRGLPTKAARR
jgi:hypothetical protein